jgi:hypothetical protein
MAAIISLHALKFYTCYALPRIVRKLDDGGEALGMALAKRLKGGAHAVLQSLRQPSENAGPLAFAAFEFLFAVALRVAHLDCRAIPAHEMSVLQRAATLHCSYDMNLGAAESVSQELRRFWMRGNSLHRRPA